MPAISSSKRYRGRFAPSPTGPLHMGSLVAALASWLDARAHGGSWIVRMEDVDEPRCNAAHGEEILRQLAVFGLVSDEPVVWQSRRRALYQAALDRLIARSAAYPCACSRADIAAWYAQRGIDKPRFGEWVYPGTCRDGVPNGRIARAWRFNHAFLMQNGLHVGEFRHKVATNTGAIQDQAHQQSATDLVVAWRDRRLGPQAQNLTQVVGDFVIKRADGYFAYQLAVVVDDADQAITHVVRGEDLADNTARQMALQGALKLPQLVYLHVPLVRAADGHKLSKQNGAAPLDERDPPQTLAQALAYLQLNVTKSSMEAMLTSAVALWRETWAAASSQLPYQPLFGDC